jgi:hypothetical protein
MSIFSDWDCPIVLFKFPSDDEHLQVPLYTEVVDKTWNPPDLDEIVNYLRQGQVIAAAPAFKPIVCPICGETIAYSASSQQSDGHWIWPSPLPHYVQFHNVRLPDRMVEQIRSNHYRPPV